MMPLSVLVVLLAVLAFSQQSLAGPNAGGRLLIYESDLVYSVGGAFCESDPVSCEEAVTRADHLNPVLLAVVAAFDNVPARRLSAVTFGLTYDEERIVILDSGHCGDFEIRTDEWPAPGSGTALTFNEPRDDTRSVVYWLAAYSYTGEEAVLALWEHPTQGAQFADDSTPAILDPIADLGEFGFYIDGTCACPPSRGACCLPSSICVMLSEDRCLEGGGAFSGIGSTCLESECSFSADWLWELLNTEESSPFELYCVLPPDSIYALIDSSYVVRPMGSGAVVSLNRAAAESLFVGGAQIGKLIGDSASPPAGNAPVYFTVFEDAQVPLSGAYTSQDLAGNRPYWGTEYGIPFIRAGYWLDGSPYMLEEPGMHTVMDNTPMRNGTGIDLSNLSSANITFVVHGAFPPAPDNGRFTIRTDDEPTFTNPAEYFVPFLGDRDGPWMFRFDVVTPNKIYWQAELTRDGISAPIMITSMIIEGVPEAPFPDLTATVSNVLRRANDHWMIDFDAKISRMGDIGDVRGPVRLGLVRRAGLFDPYNFNPGEIETYIEFSETEVEYGTPKQVTFEFGGGSDEYSDGETFWAIADPDRWHIEADELGPNCGIICGNNVDEVYYGWPLPQLPVVFVHGFMGSKISKNYPGGNQIVWSDNLLTMGKTLLLQPDKLRKERNSQLEREYDDPSTTATASGFINSVTIGSISSVLRAVRVPGGPMFPYELEWVLPSITAFPVWTGMKDVSSWSKYDVVYDFRRSLQSEAFSDIGQVISDAKEDNYGAANRIVVVSHSIGSLAVQGYIRDARENGQDPGIWSWVSLGGPFEGTSHVYSALMGMQSSGLGGLVVNHVVANNGRKIAEASAGAYSALPVDGHEDRIIYGRLENCVPYCEVFWKDVADGSIETMWTRTWADIEVGNVPAGGLPFDWYLDPWASIYSSDFWLTPETEDMPARMARVVSDARPTVSGVYWMSASAEGPYPEPLRLYVAVPGEAGDGAVEHFSAVAGDVSDVTHFYVDEEHRKLPSNPHVVEAMTRWAKGDTHNPLPDEITTTAPGMTRSPLVIEARVLTSTITDDGEAPLETPFPIGIELVDHSTGTPEFLVANVLTESGGTAVVQNVAFGNGVTAYAAERQLFLFVDPGLYSRKLSLILTPDPLFWTPYDPPVAGQGAIADDAIFDVRCQVLLHDNDTVWSFPGDQEGGDLITFTRVWDGSSNDPRGFAARADFWLHWNGDIDGIDNPNTIELSYDGDADGVIDRVVTGILGSSSESGTGWEGFISPNPFSSFTRVFTGSSSGPARLRVFDSTGRLVAQEHVHLDQSGAVEVASDILGRAYGVMFFQLEQDGKSFVTKGVRLRQ